MIARSGRKASRRRDRFMKAEVPIAPRLLKDTSRASVSAALPGGGGGFPWNGDPIVPEQLLQLGDSGVDTAVPAILQRCLAPNIAAAPVGRVGLVALPHAVKLLASFRFPRDDVIMKRVC